MTIELNPEHQLIADEARTRIARLISLDRISEIDQPLPEIEGQL